MQAQPRSLLPACMLVVGLHKELKELGLIFWTNTDTGIGHTHLDEPPAVIRVLAQGKAHLSVIGKFDRVVHQVDQDLAERAPIGLPHDRLCRADNRQRYPLLLSQRAKARSYFIDQ